LVKKAPIDDSLKGKVAKRFSQSNRRVKGDIARDRFAFDQAMQGHDCQKIREGGDFVVQERDFFGNKVGYGPCSFKFDFPFFNPAVLITWCCLWPIALRWLEIESTHESADQGR